MAEISNQTGMAPVVPIASMPPIEATSIPTAAPMAAPEPELTPSQQFDVAVDARDPKKAMQVATANIGTPVAIAAVKAADLMLKGEEAFKNMIGPIEKAGGLGTPDGNIAAAKQASQYFKQEDPNLRNAFVYWLTGDSEMARNMITGGKTVTSVIPDINGKMIQVTKNQLGKIVDAEEVGGRKLTEQEYQQRAVGRQRYEDTLNFKSQEKQQEANIVSFKQSQEVNTAFASAAPEMESKYASIYDELGYLRESRKGLGAKQYADVLKFASQSLGKADSVSKGSSTLDQANQNRAASAGKTLTNEQISNLNIGGDKNLGWRWTNKGIETVDGKQSISFDELKQKQSTENRNNELTQNFQQTRKNLIESEKFKQLVQGDQNRLLSLLENSYQVGQKQLELRAKHGTPTFMILPSSVEIEDQYGLGQAKAIQGIFNAKALQLYDAYQKKALAQSGGIVPDPKELEAGFTRTQEYKTLLKQAKISTDKVMDEPIILESDTVTFPNADSSGPKAPPKNTSTAKKPEGKKPSLADLAKSFGGN